MLATCLLLKSSKLGLIRHFECGPFDHSGIFPWSFIGCKINVSRQTMQGSRPIFSLWRGCAGLVFSSFARREEVAQPREVALKLYADALSGERGF